eukprot:IDg11260t1
MKVSSKGEAHTLRKSATSIDKSLEPDPFLGVSQNLSLLIADSGSTFVISLAFSFWLGSSKDVAGKRTLYNLCRIKTSGYRRPV